MPAPRSLARRWRAVLVALLVLPLLVAGVAEPASSATRTGSKILAAKRIALRQLGDPYRYGAAGPNRFDCSGLVYFSTHHAGFTHVPRTSSQQAHFMRRIPRTAMRPGDFVFFTGSSGVYHVGIFLGRSHGHRIIVHALPRDPPTLTAPGARVER